MRLLLDQGLPRSTVLHLQTYGIEAGHVGDLGLATASDSKILDFGSQKGMLQVCSEDLLKGAMVSVTVNGIRIRRLPVSNK